MWQLGLVVRDHMLGCVKTRLGATLAPNRVEWLIDNGSCFAAKNTVEFASWLGLSSRFTPVRSPESIGMAEASVKTSKRDYVYVNDRPDAQTVLSQLAEWIEDYNEINPHKELRMLSPREFIRFSATAGSLPPRLFCIHPASCRQASCEEAGRRNPAVTLR